MRASHGFPLAEGSIITGAVKWNVAAVGIDLHSDHLAMLERGPAAGRRWAHEALQPEAPSLYAAASGFDTGFGAVAARGGSPRP